MTTSRWDTGLPSSGELTRIAREARALPRESMSRGVKTFAAATVLIWLVTVVVTFFTLPERVPTHWSGEAPDDWSSRWGALAMEVISPVVIHVLLIGVSRLTFRWPQGINAPNKEYWLATPQRLNHFERLLREDMSLIGGLTMLLFAGLSIITGVAAHRPGGTLPGVVFALVMLLFVAGILGTLVRMLLGGRYRGEGDAF